MSVRREGRTASAYRNIRKTAERDTRSQASNAYVDGSAVFR
jgi:hypothetical protein